MMPTTKPPPGRLKVWLEAARPRTLPLALASIGMGSIMAAAHGRFDWPVALFCALTTAFLQILSNLANDYGDSLHGADSDTREGPRRAVQSGLILRRDMQKAIALCALLAMVSGVVLLYLAFGLEQMLLFLLFIGLGAAALWAAVAYTATRNPYGYAGFGDLFVLIFFGWVGTLGSYYVQAQTLPLGLILPATAVGLFSVGVLNVNNTRDIASDRQAGKRSIPVRLGLARARRYHWFLLSGGLICALAFVLFNYRSPWQFLFLITLPLFIKNGRAVSTLPPNQLDPLLKQLSLTTLLFVVTFGIGHILG